MFKQSKLQEQKKDFSKELEETVNKICFVSKDTGKFTGKGFLAADESIGTIGKRFKMIDVENNEENRRSYREILFSTSNIENYISGVIMFEETLFHKTESGKPFVDLLNEKGIVPGIKTDKGVQALPFLQGEGVTQGITDLHDRSAKYYEAGARFAKWRAVIRIEPEKGIPTETSIRANADNLAMYAAISQANGLVPVVEPEVLMDGDHDIDTCYEVTRKVLSQVFKSLQDYNVNVEHCLLKPNMVLPGKEWSKKNVSTKEDEKKLDEEIAKKTLKVMRLTVPPAVQGILFLSGGQTEDEAVRRLNLINKYAYEMGRRKAPWLLSFSYGRALQKSCLVAWKGDKSNFENAQKAFSQQAKLCYQATKGEL